MRGERFGRITAYAPTAGERIAQETGLAFVETRDGKRVEGIY